MSRGGTARRLQGVVKRNNTPSASTAKITIRRKVLDAIGAENAHVLDAFAGDGYLYRAVWSDAASCIGCDLEFYNDERTAFVCDNLRVLRAIDLAPFTIFDLDAHGSPWEQAYIIAARRKLRPGESIGLVLTEGQGLKMNLGGMSIALSLLSGVYLRLPGMGRAQDELIDRAITRVATMMGGTVTRRWEAASPAGSKMHYIGLVLTATASA